LALDSGAVLTVPTIQTVSPHGAFGLPQGIRLPCGQQVWYLRLQGVTKRLYGAAQIAVPAEQRCGLAVTRMQEPRPAALIAAQQGLADPGEPFTYGGGGRSLRVASAIETTATVAAVGVVAGVVFPPVARDNDAVVAFGAGVVLSALGPVVLVSLAGKLGRGGPVVVGRRGHDGTDVKTRIVHS